MSVSQRLHRYGREAGQVLVSPLRPVVQPRRADVCCCGLSKTGTHSMAGLFAGYRSAHHPDAARRLRLAASWLDGTADESAVRKTLGRRDRVMWLEMEASSLAGILVAPLFAACPGKRFVLTIRDVYSWCDSWIDHNVNWPADPSSLWTILDRARLRVDEHPPTRWDEPLTARGMPSLASFFQLWTAHNTRVLDAVPPSRLLVIRTSEITERIDEVAAWAGVPPETLARGRAWLAAAPAKHAVLARLDSSYVRETAERLCAPLMSTFFPDVRYEPRPAVQAAT